MPASFATVVTDVGNYDSGSPQTIAVNPGTPTGAAIVVFTSTAPTSVTYGGVSATLKSTSGAAQNGSSLRTYEVTGIPSGSQNVVVSVSGNQDVRTAVIPVLGGNTSSVIDGSAPTASSSGTTLTVAITVAASRLAACVMATDGSQGDIYSPSAGTSIFDASGGSLEFAGVSRTGSFSDFVWNGTYSSNTRVGVAFVLAEASGGGSAIAAIASYYRNMGMS
jgi:hypothetical protein